MKDLIDVLIGIGGLLSIPLLMWFCALSWLHNPWWHAEIDTAMAVITMMFLVGHSHKKLKGP